MVCLGEPGRILTHHTKGQTFAASDWALEFFSPQEWFTISIDVRDGRIHQYYCNIAEPARLVGETLSFVDLDLDLVRRPGKGWEVVDEDELETNAQRFGYPPALAIRARAELEELRRRIRSRDFPFDGTLRPYVEHVAALSLRPL